MATGLQRSFDPRSGGSRFKPAPPGPPAGTTPQTDKQANAGGNPLVQRMGLQEVLEREESLAQPEPTAIDDAQAESSLAGHVRLVWARNKLIKERIDLQLLADLRARRGIYSPAELAQLQQEGGGNIVWAPLTEVKCRAASAWIRDILLPVGERPWGLEPTPLPDLPFELKKTIVVKAMTMAKEVMLKAAEAGGGVTPSDEFKQNVAEIGEKLRDEAEKEMERAAAKRALRMEKVIDDRMVQGGYFQAMDEFIEDFVTYPAAILKGPIYERRTILKWGKTKSFTPEVKTVAVPTWKRVSPFDFYPSSGTDTPQRGDVIERLRYTRGELFNLKGLPGYKDDEIDGALRDYSEGHLEGWLWTESERQRLEQETTYMQLTQPGLIDALSYWGSVPGWKLMSWGVKEDLEETRDYECNVVVCGHYVLYAALNPNPLGRRPYRKACYDAVPGAFWGRSIPNLASTPQKMCNAAASAQADNLSIASGPQAWVHNDRLADGEDSLSMFPWKIWQLKSDPTQGVNPGVGFFQPNDNSANLMAVYEKWEIKADDSTGIPRYTYGNERAGGSADTASGLHTLMNNAAKGLRRSISNVDTNVTAPNVEDQFINEMLYNPDPSIKGDNIVVPRGAAAILIKESAQARRTNFLGMTANPIDAAIIGGKYRAALLREVAGAMELDVDAVVPSDEEIEKQAAAAAQSQDAMLEKQLQIENAKVQGKEGAIAAREASSQDRQFMHDLVRDAVSSALKPQTAPGKEPKAQPA
jgi:hypothetical protein